MTRPIANHFSDIAFTAIPKTIGSDRRSRQFASSVYGVGPTTASKILAKMDETEKEFLNDLFEAKPKYVTTRPYWNEPQAKPKMY